MSNDLEQHVEGLHRRREAPVQGIIAATALGRKAALLRDELDGPARHLEPGEADNTVSALTLTLWDTSVSSTQRAAAAWALGQIGGLQPTRKLLNRLETLFVRRGAKVLGPADKDGQEEVNDVCATLVEALARAVDAPTAHILGPDERRQLHQVCSALLDHICTSQESDPDLSTALAMSLARLALRAGIGIPRDTLRNLLNAREPVATLAAVGALTELIPTGRRDEVLDYLLTSKPGTRLDADLHRLGESRRRLYRPEEIRRLLQLTTQFWHAEQDTQVTSDHLWEKIEKTLQGTDFAHV